ncbi:MAG: inositol monophosphatase family protein [Archaeoglobaceae archaeon]
MDASDALKISREVVKNVRRALSSLPFESRRVEVGMGKDGTPTKLVDSVAERAALEVLKKENVTVVSEEAGIVGEGDIFVALDPIDGTFNAERGIPLYSVSLCFSNGERFGEAFFGYVYNLATGDEYYASQRAFWNGREVSVSDEVSLNCNAIFYYPTKLMPFKRTRIFGCASLELCFVATGVFDCFIDVRNMLRIFDAAAGLFVIERAGGVVSDVEGRSLYSKRFSMEERLNIVAANPELHAKLLELVR